VTSQRLPVEVINIVGPTASGKTALSLAVASALDAEIVNLDAYQIYRDMNIGTAKPSSQELALVKHHCIDIADISQTASVSDFQTLARTAIREINSRGKRAICVGGSGLYVKAVLDEMDFPGVDLVVRARYEALSEQLGSVKLHELLATKDPLAAAAIDAGNVRRVVRALEVIETTGQPYTAVLPSPTHIFRDIRICLDVTRDQLAPRIAQRVDAMWVAGWPNEVAELAARGLFNTPTASKALGYASVDQFNRGEISELDAKMDVSFATLKFTKKQMQWFRRDDSLHWLQWDAPDLVAQALHVIETFESQN
jgi:tRNA dimethylallyltransferase